jgi:hypothetical protein
MYDCTAHGEHLPEDSVSPLLIFPSTQQQHIAAAAAAAAIL